MTDAERKRAYVSDLYSGKGWKHKVSKMSDDQIVAIYLKHQNDGKEPEAYSEPELEPEPIPEPLVDVPQVRHGPHANEDDFPLY